MTEEDVIAEAMCAARAVEKKLEHGVEHRESGVHSKLEMNAATGLTTDAKRRARKGVKGGDENWKKLLKSSGVQAAKGKRRLSTKKIANPEQPKKTNVSLLRDGVQLTKVVAIDCEFVGTGEDGRCDTLARVSVVNFREECLLDAFVVPEDGVLVVDYRTPLSGVTEEDLRPESGAVPFEIAQKAVLELISNRIVVGHGLRSDLRVLKISDQQQPHTLRRDTSEYRAVRTMAGLPSRRVPALRVLASRLAEMPDLQTGRHDSREDATAALRIYKRCAVEWERSLQNPRGAAGKSSSRKRRADVHKPLVASQKRHK